MKLRRFVNWLLNLLLIIFVVIGVYLFYDKFFVGSPTDFQFILWLLGISSTSIIKLFTLLYGLNREVGELKIGVRSGFGGIKKDIGNLNQKLEVVNQRLDDISK